MLAFCSPVPPSAPGLKSGQGLEATVTAAGQVAYDGQVFDSPSGAASYIEGRASNGWHFWRLADGRRLADLRALI